MDQEVQFPCQQGIAASTRKTYQPALQRFSHFYTLYNVLTPFPVSESLLCYFTVHSSRDKLAPQTIKVYLAAIRHMQITMGLPETQEFSSMPRLHLLQTDIQRVHSSNLELKVKIRLPITPAMLHRIKEHWTPYNNDSDIIMLWVAATICFFEQGR